ncbi:MAG: efflux RND transporter periplasmic adaptor subunit [Epsilonproteobacteria bacterium]|nr:efflux RND transporter periplasmic adaptor subunit [Campylobacterota bacterium]
MKKTLALLVLSTLPLLAEDIVLPGTVISNGQKMIGSRYMGYISKVFVKLGDKVKREDDLYEMESAEFDIMKSQADLMLEQSQVVLEFWRSRIKRINTKKNKLKNKKLNKIAQIDFDDLEAQAENAQAMIETSQIMVEEASIKAKQMATVYNYLKMKAPSDGVIVQKNIKPGDMVMPGMLTIMMVDTEDLTIDISISESTLKVAKVGMDVKVLIPALDYKTKGTIDAIIPDANPMTHRIKMRVTFDKKDQNVFPGMYAKVILEDVNMGFKPLKLD